MTRLLSLSGGRPARAAAAFAFAAPRSVDAGGLDVELARAFETIRDCARIAWWDGSAIGLRLNGFLGLVEGLETEPEPARGDRR